MIIEEKKLPDFIVIGVPKSGTTSLFNYMCSFKEFYKPRVKEPFYFISDSNNYIISSTDESLKKRIYDMTLEQYQSIYKNCNEDQITGDFSTHYFHNINQFIKKMEETYGDEYKKLPIILILRNPIDRAFSHYVMKRRDNNENLSFQDAIQEETINDRIERGFVPTFDYIRFSRYKKNLKILNKNFNNVLVIKFEVLKNDKIKLLESVGEFLNLDASNLINNIEKNSVLNKSGVPKDNYFSKFLHWVQYRENILKKILPMKVRKFIHKNYSKNIKSKLSNITLTKPEISDYDYNLISEILEDEVNFYDSL